MKEITLPGPMREGNLSIEEALQNRMSVREYVPGQITLAEAGQVLWSAQGINRKVGRTAPSAGATYPLEVYLVAGEVERLQPGIYHYIAREHKLALIQEGDYRRELQQAALDQECVGSAQMDIVICGVYERTTQRYGERGTKYVHMEAGHAAQNIYLQAASLGLGTVVVGAFQDQEVDRVLNLTEKEAPLYIMPVGRI